MNKEYQLVLFDLDGTVADTDEMIVESMHALYDLYRDGVYTPIEQIYYFSGPSIVDTLKKEFPDGNQEMLLKEFSRISKELYPKTIKTYPLCKETILALKEKGVKVGLVTNKMKKMTLYCLELIDLKDVFDVIIGYDDVSIGKPNGEGILKAIKTLGVKDLQKVLYVGDNKIDFDTASNAGVDSAIVTWGPRILPSDIHPTYKIASYEELRRLIIHE